MVNHLALKEFGVACVRNSKFLELMSWKHIHPGDCIGDLGGAMANVLMALSALDKNKTKLIYGSSDYEFRGAVCVS